MKASVAASILAITAAVSAGAGFVGSRAMMTAQVEVNCPQPSVATAPVAPQSKPFPPLGNLPATTGGQKF